MDIGSSLPNGHSSDLNDAMSIYGASKSGKAVGLINTMAGVSGQSTLSRKSGKTITQKIHSRTFHTMFSLATSVKTTERSHDARVLSRDLLKKRNLLLTLLVISTRMKAMLKTIVCFPGL